MVVFISLFLIGNSYRRVNHCTEPSIQKIRSDRSAGWTDQADGRLSEASATANIVLHPNLWHCYFVIPIVSLCYTPY